MDTKQVEEVVHHEMAEAEASFLRQTTRIRRTMWLALVAILVTVIGGLLGVVWSAGHVDQNVKDLTLAAKELHNATDNVRDMVLILNQQVKDQQDEIDRLERVLELGHPLQKKGGVKDEAKDLARPHVPLAGDFIRSD